jgi:sensor histidine kinase YesM
MAISKIADLKVQMEESNYRLPVSLVLFSAIGYLIGIFMMYSDPKRLIAFNYLNIDLFFFYIPVANIIGFSNELVLFQLNKILPWKSFMLARFSAGYFVSFVVAAIIIFITISIIQKQGLAYYIENQISEDHFQLLLKLLVILSFILFVYNLLHLALYSYQSFFINSLKIRRMKREQMDLHIEALKNQLTPHYLFNNLNTISALLLSNKSLTDKYIRSFINTCQFIIENSRNVLIKLEDELEFIKSYQTLMEIRYPAMIKIETDVSESIRSRFLPPLSLQMLVENAIKHNTLNSDNLLHVRIFSEGKNYLVVENNLMNFPKNKLQVEKNQGNEKKTSSTQLGIQNIKMRYAYLTQKPVKLDQRDKFSVKIPLLRLKEEYGLKTT